MSSRRQHISSQLPLEDQPSPASAAHADFEPADSTAAADEFADSLRSAKHSTRLGAAIHSHSLLHTSGMHNGTETTDPALSDRTLQQSACGMDNSMWSASFNLTNVITGSGIIGLPYAAQQCGLLVALVMLLATAAATHYSLQLLVRSAHRLHRKRPLDMEDVMYECFGQTGRWAALLAVFLLDFGVLVALLIIIGDTVPPVLDFYLGASLGVLTGRHVVLLLVSLLFILPASCMRSLSSLSLISLTSVISVLLLTSLVVARSLSSTARPASSSSISELPLVGSNLLSGFGSIVFVFVCHDVSLQLYHSLRVRSPITWRRVSSTSIYSALLPILLLTAVGYLCFQHTTRANILNNFPSDDAAINVSRLVLALSMSLTYPSNLIVCRSVLMRAFAPSSVAMPSSAASSLHYPLTAVLFAASLLIALRVEDLGVVQSVVGSVCAVSVAFLIPSACAVQGAHRLGEPYFSRGNSGAALIAALGCCVIALSLYDVLVSS